MFRGKMLGKFGRAGPVPKMVPFYDRRPKPEMFGLLNPTCFLAPRSQDGLDIEQFELLLDHTLLEG